MIHTEQPPRSYSLMVKDLRRKLADGTLREGDRLQTVLELAKTYGISGNSVRLGIDVLVNEGAVTRRRGSGMYVAKTAAPARAMESPTHDRVGVFFDRWYRTYHPYYSEMDRGLRETVAAYGWATDWPVQVREAKSWESNQQIVWEPIDKDQFVEDLSKRSDLAGAIVTMVLARDIKDPAGLPFPVVVPGLTEGHICVGYDWREELVSAVRAVLRQGGRRILVVERMDRSIGPDLLQRAAIGEGVSPGEVTLHVLPAHERPVAISVLIQESFEITAAGLKDHPEADSLVVASDVLAQGAFDAVSTCKTSAVRFASAIVSRESRIQSNLPYAAITVDGYAVGRAAVELLHEHMTSRAAPRQRILRGEVRI